MKEYIYDKTDEKKTAELIKRPGIHFDKIFDVVGPILHDVKKHGLPAAVKYAKKLDGFTASSIYVEEKEILKAERNLDKKIKDALETAYQNIRKFHVQETPRSFKTGTHAGIFCSREFRPIDNVGLYVPGGNAILPSTVLMLGIPAQIARCPRVVLCTPVKGKRVNYALLYAAHLCGIKEIIKIGGPHAVGLLAYGAGNFAKVDKIFGPGNQYVTASKMLVSIDPSGCAIDLPAGPSELLIIADDSANPSFIASDLLSQAEHGEDSQVVLVTNSENLIMRVKKEINVQISALPRHEIIQQSLKKSFSLLVNNIKDAFVFSNRYAPEHLILNIKRAADYTDRIHNAGSVFLGEYSPESAGDYASGTNHSLPTSGYARAFGGVGVESFMKSITFQHLTKEGLKRISTAIETLAETEGLSAHKNAVTIRIK
jgi:histidinol dehydrogenase